jgi:hypothetical protein
MRDQLTLHVPVPASEPGQRMTRRGTKIRTDPLTEPCMAALSMPGLSYTDLGEANVSRFWTAPQEPCNDSKAEIRQVPLVLGKEKPRAGKRRNLGTFDTREAAQKHEREVQFFKRKK